MAAVSGLRNAVSNFRAPAPHLLGLAVVIIMIVAILHANGKSTAKKILIYGIYMVGLVLFMGPLMWLCAWTKSKLPPSPLVMLL
jgi:hypothetical protein